VDPSLDPQYAATLRRRCKTLTDNTTIVEMDPGSFLTFDLSYYRGVLKRRGLFQSDAALITDATSKADILSVVNAPPEVFFQVFARSMVRMGAIDVKTGSEGEIRKHCAFVNKH
jgi:peroxidase